MFVELKAKTDEGSDKLFSARSTVWEVIQTKDVIGIEGKGGGKWLQITPIGRTAFDKTVMWIHLTHDKNFYVKENFDGYF